MRRSPPASTLGTPAATVQSDPVAEFGSMIFTIGLACEIA